MTERQDFIEEDEIDLRKLVEALRRNLISIAIITFVVVVGAGLYAYFAPPIYSSSVTISLESQDQKAQLGKTLESSLLTGLKNDKLSDLAKVTLQSKKFIKTILDKVDIDQVFFIEKNFKKVEIDTLPNLKIDIQYQDDQFTDEFTLYEELFEIIPLNEKEYELIVDEIGYDETHQFNEKVENPFFTLRVIPIENNTTGMDEIASDSYFFKTFDREAQIEKIIENMTVTDISDTILEISYNDTLPSRTQKVATEIAESFIEYNLQNRTDELEQTLSFLNDQIVDIKTNLKSEEEKLKEYQQNSGTAVLGSAETVIDLLEQKNEQVEKVKLQIEEIQRFITNLQQNDVASTVSLASVGIDTVSIEPLISSFIASNEELQELRLQQNSIDKSISSNILISTLVNDLKEQENLLQSLLSDFTEDHPQVIKQQREIDLIKSKIHANIIANIEKIEKKKALARAALLSNMQTTENNLRNKLRIQQSDIQSKTALLASMPEKTLINQGLQRSFDLSSDIYTLLLQKKIEAEISKASTLADTKIIEDAYIAEEPIKPKKPLIVIVGLVVGLILGILFALLKELMDNKIRGVHDIEELTRVPLYGTLPLNDNPRFFQEALRNIRTNLQFVLSGDKNCTRILISSTVAGEGKTTVSAGLSKIIAHANKKVILIDLDLRKPRLHKELKQSNKVGVSNILSENIDYRDLIVNLEENLDFLSAGTIPPNPSELLMSEKLNRLISALEEEYDYILFDTPPIGSVTDANMLLRHSDIVLLIVRANAAEKNYLTHFDKMIEDKKIKSAGIILNGVKLYKSKGYGYGYGYGYDYSYGEEKSS